MLSWFKRKRKQKDDSEQTSSIEKEQATVPAQEDEPGAESEPEPQATVDAEEPVTSEASGEPAAAPDEEISGDDLQEISDDQETVEEVIPQKSDGKDSSSGSSEADKPSLLRKLSSRLSRTRESFTSRIDELFLGKKEIDAELFDDLEEIMVTADLGISTTQEMLEIARKRVKRDSLSDPRMLKAIIKEQLKEYITLHDKPSELKLPDDGPFVIMVVGVNGVGKTTTIGKIAAKFTNAGQSVLLVAADTFRAAAAAQLKIWGERNNVRVISQHEGADPSSVVFDAMDVAMSKNFDVVLIDTAGRLHTKVNLMEELKKIKRVIGKRLADAPHEILLVIDATTGQNGISQATLFNEAVGVTGIALTKLDGTAKGGIVANIAKELKMPIRFIGVGEQIDDLRDFDADEFLDALFDSNASPEAQNR